MALALNLIALLLVVGLSWAAMLWLSGRFHGDKHRLQQPVADQAARADTEVSRARSGAPCGVCDGLGAQHERGRLRPCPSCEGTGVLA